MLPAPGQGALGIQMREEDSRILKCQGLDCPHTRISVEAERAFLHALGGGCAQPIAAWGEIDHNQIHLHGFWSDGQSDHRRSLLSFPITTSSKSIGLALAQKIKQSL